MNRISWRSTITWMIERLYKDIGVTVVTAAFAITVVVACCNVIATAKPSDSGTCHFVSRSCVLFAIAAAVVLFLGRKRHANAQAKRNAQRAASQLDTATQATNKQKRTSRTEFSWRGLRDWLSSRQALKAARGIENGLEPNTAAEEIFKAAKWSCASCGNNMRFFKLLSRRNLIRYTCAGCNARTKEPVTQAELLTIVRFGERPVEWHVRLEHRRLRKACLRLFTQELYNNTVNDELHKIVMEEGNWK